MGYLSSYLKTEQIKSDLTDYIQSHVFAYVVYEQESVLSQSSAPFWGSAAQPHTWG